MEAAELLIGRIPIVHRDNGWRDNNIKSNVTNNEQHLVTVSNTTETRKKMPKAKRGKQQSGDDATSVSNVAAKRSEPKKRGPKKTKDIVVATSKAKRSRKEPKKT